MFETYGFKKFIVVVPSVAIREGVLKSIEIMKEHFRDLYNPGRCPFLNEAQESQKR